MLRKVLLVSATEAEANALLRIPDIKFSGYQYFLGEWEISVLITGVGSISTSWSMIKWISANPRPELSINIGIAGSYNTGIGIGEVVVPLTDCFADLGIEVKEGFSTLWEAGLGDPDRYPFKGGKLIADNEYVAKALKILKPVNAITVNTATGTQESIRRLSGKFNPDIETMEGATFFYICSRENIPYLALRAISNRVEPRNKNNWNIPLALKNLSGKLRDFLLMDD
jgi:futalosine hydrolase